MDSSYRIDAGATYLPVCTTAGCPWRGYPTLTLLRALAQAAAHEADAHPGQRHARKALWASRSRARGREPAAA